VDYGDKLEHCRTSYDAFNRRDLEQLLRLYHDECEWHMSNYDGWPEDRVYRGHEGMAQFFNTWLEPWEYFLISLEEASDLPDDRIFLVAQGHGRGRLSQAPVEIPPLAQIIEFRDGALLRVDNYSDVETARRAAGL